MKKIIKIYIAIIASLCLFMSFPADIYAVVIDVSSYNGFIQLDNMKNYIEGAIIRIGYGSDIQSQDDTAAIRNMDECERLGIPTASICTVMLWIIMTQQAKLPTP